MAIIAQLVLGVLCLFASSQVGNMQSIDQIISSAMDTDAMAAPLDDGHTVRVELDMLFKQETWAEIQRLNKQENLEGRQIFRQKRKAIRDLMGRWADRVVPYVIADNNFSAADLQQIQAAMDEWQRYTCIKFRPRTPDDLHSVNIFSGLGCYSYVGRIGGQQDLSLAPLCTQKGVIVHELGHAIGFFHEQTRPDRDNFVEILTDNIAVNNRHDFQRHSPLVQDGYFVPYDYTSIMHYGQYSFSINGQPTIRTLDSTKQKQIGNRYQLSFRDIELANLMYECAAECEPRSCPGEGFLGADCQCWCPGIPVQFCSKCTGVGSGSIVAFDVSQQGDLGPFRWDTIITFNTVNFNIGEGWDERTYRFVAPVSGIYSISVLMRGVLVTEFHLMVNNEEKMRLVTTLTYGHHGTTASTNNVLNLIAGTISGFEFVVLIFGDMEKLCVKIHADSPEC